MKANRIRSVVIAGGGTAGWLTAASLARHFQNTGLKIVLIESSRIGTVGVGEATIPSIRRSYQAIGLSDSDVISATNATCKLGIRFDGWAGPQTSFFHPFGLFGHDVNQVAFHHYWLKLKQDGSASDFAEFSLPAVLAENGKFDLPTVNPSSALSVFDWALHFDASLFANVMKRKALEQGVVALDSVISEVKTRTDDGFIESLILEDGQCISGDLFIDCSGFNGLLIEQALKTGYEDWSHWLYCDRAVAVQSESDSIDNPPPFTLALSDELALEGLLADIKGQTISDPNVIKFSPGRRSKAWNKNCIALGLAAGFLEPLESTSIALIETGIEKIKRLFPNRDFDVALISEFNDMTRLEYERVRDFIVLHYKLNRRNGEQFWDHCRDAPIPDSLEHKMTLFKQRGHLVKYRWEIFQDPSWLALYNGFGYWPEDYDPAADNFSVEYLQNALADMQKSINHAVTNTRTHQQFLQEHATRSAK